MATPQLSEVDPFDLPEWLGTGFVTWASDAGVRSGHHVRGLLTCDDDRRLDCDLLAVDRAHPVPVVDEASRSRAHQAWQHGQVLLGEYDGRLVLGVPGTVFDADLVLDALGRLAKAVGASADHYAVRLRVGAEEPGRGSR